ncbi:MAG: hypothetical protein ACYC3I_20920, partial [Gemmataceae bacterium]
CVCGGGQTGGARWQRAPRVWPDVSDFLESLPLEDDKLRYNDKLLLRAILVKANELHSFGESQSYFDSLDKRNLQLTAHCPKMAR